MVWQIWQELQRFEFTTAKRVFGIAFRLVSYAALFVVLYYWMPESILDRPLVSIKVDETLAWLVYILLALLLLRALFNPHKDAREAWETYGFTVLPIVLVIAGTWLLLHSVVRVG